MKAAYERLLFLFENSLLTDRVFGLKLVEEVQKGKIK